MQSNARIVSIRKDIGFINKGSGSDQIPLKYFVTGTVILYQNWQHRQLCLNCKKFIGHPRVNLKPYHSLTVFDLVHPSIFLDFLKNLAQIFEGRSRIFILVAPRTDHHTRRLVYVVVVVGQCGAYVWVIHFKSHCTELTQISDSVNARSKSMLHLSSQLLTCKIKYLDNYVLSPSCLNKQVSFIDVVQYSLDFKARLTLSWPLRSGAFFDLLDDCVQAVHGLVT